jgi:hypothetical protein
MPKFVAATPLVFLAALFAASPQTTSAQSAQTAYIGTWKVNLAKSTYSPGPAPKSQTSTVEAEGQGIRITNETINAQGNPAKIVLVEAHDGKFHPVTGNPAYDAESETDISNSASVIIRTKAGRVVQALIAVISPDRKTWTVTNAGVNADGRQYNNVVVREKQ